MDDSMYKHNKTHNPCKITKQSAPRQTHHLSSYLPIGAKSSLANFSIDLK
jgi:hypothetical protein